MAASPGPTLLSNMLILNGVQLLNFKQGRNHGKFLGEAKPMDGRNLLPWLRKG